MALLSTTVMSARDPLTLRSIAPFSLSRDLAIRLGAGWAVSCSRPGDAEPLPSHALRTLETQLDVLAMSIEQGEVASDEQRAHAEELLVAWLRSHSSLEEASFAQRSILPMAPKSACPHLLFVRRDALPQPAPVMLWMTGADGLPQQFNDAWLRFRGTAHEQERELLWTEKIHHEDFERWLDASAKAFASRASFDVEIRMRGGDGAHHRVHASGAPVFGASGAYEGYLGASVVL